MTIPDRPVFHLRDIPRILFSLALAASAPVYLTFALAPEGPVLPIVLFMVLTNALYFLRSRITGLANTIMTIGLGALLTLGAAVVFIDIIITPYSAYLTWFGLMSDGEPRGSISYIFVMTSAFLLSIVAGSSYRTGPVKALLTTLFFAVTLAAIMNQSMEQFLLSVLALAVLLIAISVKGYRGRNVVRAATASITVLGVAFVLALFVTGEGQPHGSRLVDTSLSPTMRELVVSAFPEFPIIYGIPGYGYSFDRRGLGETPVLSQRSIFQVEAEPGRTIYLRTAVYNYYAGNNWAISERLLDRAKRNRSARFERPSRNEYDETVRITVLNDFYAMIPHTLDSVSFDIRRSKPLYLTYGSDDTGYLLDQPLLNGQVITLYERKGAGLAGGGVPEDDEERLEDAELYLNLPDRISRDLSNLAARLSRDTPEATAEAIRQYLSEQYLYTLNTTHPEGEDLVEYFLFRSREGYCVHFASTFALLARMNGIPTRYATGFLTRIPSDQPVTRVSGYSAHAWPEIWLPGQGWTIIEATPPLRYNPYDDEYYYLGLFMDEDELTSRQLRELIGSRALIPNGTGTVIEGSPVVGFSSTVALWTALLVAAGGITALTMIAIRRTFVASDLSRRIAFLSSRIVRRTERIGIPHPSKSGWLRWAEEVERLERSGTERSGSENGAGSEVRRFLSVVIPIFFGNRRPQKRDLEVVKHFGRSLRLRRFRGITAAERASRSLRQPLRG